MLSNTTATATASTAPLLRKTHLTVEEQLQIEDAITAIAQERNWHRRRAAYWLHCQAFPEL